MVRLISVKTTNISYDVCLVELNVPVVSSPTRLWPPSRSTAVGLAPSLSCPPQHPSYHRLHPPTGKQPSSGLRILASATSDITYIEQHDKRSTIQPSCRLTVVFTYCTSMSTFAARSLLSLSIFKERFISADCFDCCKVR